MIYGIQKGVAWVRHVVIPMDVEIIRPASHTKESGGLIAH
jgi:hypothetical protein